MTKRERCPVCRGLGMILPSIAPILPILPFIRPIDPRCSACNGTGEVMQDKKKKTGEPKEKG